MLKLARRTLAAAMLAAAAAAPAAAQETWKMASAAQPGTVLLTLLEKTVANITKNTGGRIVAERQFVGSEQEIATQLARGRLQMGSVSFAGMSVLIPEAAVLNTPYLWASRAERNYVTDTVAWPLIVKIYEEKGFVIIGHSEVGYNGVVCKAACPSPASVKGLKARVSPTPASKMFWTQVGGNGVQLPLSELFPALEQNLVVAADLPFSYYITTPAATSAPHFVDTQHLHHPATAMVNKALFDKLAPDLQAALRASPVPIDEFRKAVDDEEKPKIEQFRAKGGKFIELTDEQRAEWRRLVEPAQGELIKGIGGRAQELFDLIQKGKKEFAEKTRKS